MNNPFGLVYEDTITENLPGRVQIRPVTYEMEGIKVAANLYLPADCDETGDVKYPAVAVAHPNGGCKEQVAGLYAQRLAESGFIALACDARYQGESGGEPRLRDYPANRVEDISGMVDYLTLLPMVDARRIGALGICGGGGYTLAAAQTDKRIKAVATLSMFNSGRVRRNGFLDSAVDTIQQRLCRSAEARNEELRGNVQYEGFLPPNATDDELRAKMAKLPENTLYRDGIEYYGLSHKHPNATGSYTTASFMKLMAFDVEDRMGLIDQPLLMIAGEKADTLYMTQDAFNKATGTDDKELCLIEGASHIRTYWVKEYVNKAVSKLDTFFKDNLQEGNMEYITLNNGIRMPQEGFGVFQVRDKEECKRSVLDAIRAGYRLIDTAASYTNEDAVGEAIREAIAEGLCTREELFITSKMWVQDMQNEQMAAAAIDASLKNLGLEYLDLYLLHQAMRDYFSAWRAMEKAYRAGKIRAIGVSNFYSHTLTNFCETVEIRPAVNQVELHPYYTQEAALETMKYYGVQPEAWAPLGGGRYKPFENEMLAGIASAHGKTIGQVVLRWNVQRGVVVIPKSTHKKRIEENYDIWDFSLTDEEMKQISSLDMGYQGTAIKHFDPDFVRMCTGRKIHD